MSEHNDDPWKLGEDYFERFRNEFNIDKTSPKLNRMKEIWEVVNWMVENGYKPKITDLMLQLNDELDSVERNLDKAQADVNAVKGSVPHMRYLINHVLKGMGVDPNNPNKNA